jgi:hypothetical protein
VRPETREAELLNFQIQRAEFNPDISPTTLTP